MRRHLLVTVSGDKAAMHGVRFVSGFLHRREDTYITLFYTAPRPPALWEHERNAKSLDEYDLRSKLSREKGRDAIDYGMTMLREAGFPEDVLDAKLMLREVSTAQDILRESEKGLYDAIVLGRRGLAGFEALADQSVTRDILERGFVAPLWVCRRYDKSRSGVLLCLDGSGASLRMADHVGFMLQNEVEQRITMFIVTGRGMLGGQKPETIFTQALEILAENGVDPEQVDVAIAKGGSPAKAIMERAKKGGYAAVATGRTGRGRGLLRRVFMGSVSQGLLKELEGAALWMRA